MDRRQLLKAQAAMAAAAVAGMPQQANAQLITDRAQSELHGAMPRRFRGTGCGALATKDGRVVQTTTTQSRGEFVAELRKGYFLSKIAHGEDAHATAPAQKEWQVR
jgi:nitrate reductase NapA